MCRTTAGPLLAMVGVAGTAAGVVLAIVRERVDRLSDARAARLAAERQDAPSGLRHDGLKHDVVTPDSVEDESAGVRAGDSEPVESEADASK
ncbi:MAG: hypothetical protein O6922_02280 [Chloroflexi bacterium]|nr:hypothetical protein [Chloroflexota bacterium]